MGNRYAGKNGEVKIALVGQQGELVAGVTAWNVEPANEPIDVTGMDSGGSVERIPGLVRWTGSVECFVDSDSVSLIEDARDGCVINCEFVASPLLTYRGVGIVRSLTPTVEVASAVKLSISIDGTGELTT